VGQEIGGCEDVQTNNNTFLIKPGLPITTVCQEYQPISHKVYLIIAQIWQGDFKNSFPEHQVILNFKFCHECSLHFSI